MFEINLMMRGQAAQLTELQALAFKQAYSDGHSPEDIEAYCLAHYTTEFAKIDLASQNTVCCVGLLDSEPTGYYIVKHHAPPVAPDLKSSELKQIYVLSSAYSSGLGRALYEHALATIRSTGNKWVWLCVSDTNNRAKAFYKKLGFTLIGTGPVFEVGKDRLSSSILAHEV